MDTPLPQLVDMPSLYLMRHGHTVLNEVRPCQDRIGSPLTESGRLQAGRAAFMLKQQWTIVTTPLGCALGTTHIVARGLGTTRDQIKTDDRPRAVSLGTWKALTVEEVDQRDPGRRSALNKLGWPFLAPSGERFGEAAQRVLYRAEEQLRDVLVVPRGLISGILRGPFCGLSRSLSLQLSISQILIFTYTTVVLRGSSAWNSRDQRYRNSCSFGGISNAPDNPRFTRDEITGCSFCHDYGV
jgi:probable phosphoglycerate mutase